MLALQNRPHSFGVGGSDGYSEFEIAESELAPSAQPKCKYTRIHGNGHIAYLFISNYVLMKISFIFRWNGMVIYLGGIWKRGWRAAGAALV